MTGAQAQLWVEHWADDGEGWRVVAVSMIGRGGVPLNYRKDVSREEYVGMARAATGI